MIDMWRSGPCVGRLSSGAPRVFVAPALSPSHDSGSSRPPDPPRGSRTSAAATMTGQVIFYDLVGAPGGPLFSANTWKTRLSLLHKRVPFQTVELTCMDLRGEVAKRMGKERPLGRPRRVPCKAVLDLVVRLQSPSSSLPTDHSSRDLSRSPFTSSERIRTVPLSSRHQTRIRRLALTRRRSLWQECSTQVHSRLFLTLGKRRLRPFKGVGASDPQWNTFFEVSAPLLVKLQLDQANRDYFTSDYKLGMKDGTSGACLNSGIFVADRGTPAWKTITSLDQNELKQRAIASLIPFANLLQVPGTKFIASPTAPGLVDYILFGAPSLALVRTDLRSSCSIAAGRYFMVACADLALADEVFASVKRWKDEVPASLLQHPASLLINRLLSSSISMMATPESSSNAHPRSTSVMRRIYLLHMKSQTSAMRQCINASSRMSSHWTARANLWPVDVEDHWDGALKYRQDPEQRA